MRSLTTTTISKHLHVLIFLFSVSPIYAYAQVVLEADGPGNTYELINSVLAPGYNVVENPECVHPEFGRHIVEIWDNDLKQFVFEFYIHVTPDNDRCINFDRQRIEIKTYDSSPANLKGVVGETVIYKWKFKIPVGFKPSSSFTHIHQIKAVGGDEDMPIFTLSPRAGNPNKLELIHNNTAKVTTVPLSLFEGNWVEATEKIKIDNLHGTYSITIKKISDGSTILSYSNNDLMTIRSDNTFIRPKWGIYRSLDHPAELRDESMRFAGFSIEEVKTTSAKIYSEQNQTKFHVFPNPASRSVSIEYSLVKPREVKLAIYSLKGTLIKIILNTEQEQNGSYQKQIDLSDIKKGNYLIRLSSSDFTQTLKISIL